MKPSQLRIGDKALYSESNGKPVNLEFVERIKSAVRGEPTLNKFISEGFGVVFLSDAMVIHRVKRMQMTVH